MSRQSIRLIAPLYNFQSDKVQIKLDSNHEIRTYLDFVKEYGFGSNILHWTQQTKFTHLIIINYNTNETDENKIREMGRDKFEHAIRLLKLYNSDFIVWSDQFFIDLIDKTSTYVGNIPYYISWGPNERSIFQINNEEHIKLSEFWEKTHDINTKNVAIRRYSRADYNPTLDDTIVDYAIALESLFVPDARGEVGFQFRTHGTIVLSQCSIEDNSIIYEDLKELYNFRSRIVHGDSIKTKGMGHRKIDIEEFCQLIKKYTRNAILFLHKQGLLENKKKRREYYKNQIITGRE